MSIGTTAKIRAQVLAANVQAHDDCALTHDWTVPYLRRKRTRLNYESLVRNGMAQESQEIRGRSVVVKMPPAEAERSSTIDYVDYQINDGFSLSRQAGSFGKVTPYCYLCFVSLGASALHSITRCW